MRSFLKNLFHNISTTSKARAAKPSTRRATLQMEGLEDRTVPTVISFPSPGTMNISEVAPGHTIMIESNSNNQIVVLDNGAAVKGYNPVNKETISLVHIELDGNDTVVVNDSNGMPFAQDKAPAIWIYGNGPGGLMGSAGGSTFCLEGSRVVGSAESYAEVTPATEGVLSLDNITFNMDNAINNVVDSIPITGLYTVNTFDPDETLINGFAIAHSQLLYGQSNNQSHDLTFASKPTVALQPHGAGTLVTLAATQPETSELSLAVNLEDKSETLSISATPAGLEGIVVSTYSADDAVNVATNQSQLYILGNSSTSVDIGDPTPNLQSTKGIDADIFVNGVKSLIVNDSANHLPPSDAKLTSNEISGKGLFANNAVDVTFTDVSTTPIIIT